MAKLFLITGNTGAGKSTWAAVLAEQENAHIFAVDEWMKNLFLSDMPDPPSYQWALERTQRIEVQMLQESLKLLKRGVSVILDIGFFARSQRDRVQAFFRRHGQQTQLCYLDVDRETRWQRVSQRNRNRSETWHFDVSPEVFEFCETIFEPLDKQELAGALVVSP